MKKVLPGLIAVIVAISLSAFTLAKQHKTVLTGEKWFVFNGTSPADLNDPSKYSMDGDGSQNTVCLTSNPPYRCEVLAQPQSSNTSEPDLSTIIDEVTRDNP